MANLQGADELKKRLRSIGQSFKLVGKTWADTAVDVGRPMIPVGKGATAKGRGYAWGDTHDSGRLRGSLKRKTATMRKAVVGVHYTGYFVNKGVVAHSMSRRVKGESRAARDQRTVFHKKHPGYNARPFAKRMAWESIRRHPLSETVIDEWNGGA